MLQNHTIYQIKWLLGLFFAFLGILSLLLVDFLSPITLLLPLIVMGASFIFPANSHHLVSEKKVLPWVFLFLYLLVFLFFETKSLFHGCVHLLIVLTVHRALSFRSNRHDLQLLLLSVVLIVSAGVLSISLLFAIQVIILTPLSLWYLFLIHLYEARNVGRGSEGLWQYFSWGSLFTQTLSKTNFRLVLLSGVLFLLLSAGSAAFFISLPRVDLEFAQDFLKVEGKTRTGFSEEISLNEVTSMIEDNTIAFRADPPEGHRFQQVPYWRMIVFDQYENGKFVTSNSLKEKTSKQRAQIYPTELASTPTPEVSEHWVVWLEGNISRFLPMGGDFRSIRMEKSRQFHANEEVGFYHLKSVEPQVIAYLIEGMSISGVRNGSGLDRELLRLSPLGFSNFQNHSREEELSYPKTTLDLSLTLEERQILKKWVLEINQGRNLSRRDFARKIISYLGARHFYSLESSFESEGDPVIGWMRSQSGGHCELFAAAFTLLARTAGIPTRVVAGYRGASQSEYEGYMIVRNKQAHAWVEIFDEKGRWVRLDPTPGAGESQEVDEQEENNVLEEEQGSGVELIQESGFTLWLDSLRMVWYRNIVNFDSKSQEDLINTVQEESKQGIEKAKVFFEKIREWSKEQVQKIKEEPSLLLYPMLYGASLFLFFYGLIIILKKICRRIFARQTEEERLRNLASRYLQQLEKVGELDKNEEYACLYRELEYYRFGNWEGSSSEVKEELRLIPKKIRKLKKIKKE